MEPITLAATATKAAIAIARAAGLSDWLQDKFEDKPSLKAAERILALAESATATHSPEEALERINTDADHRFRVKRLLLQREEALIQLHYEDLRDARRMYGRQHDNADRIARQIMTWNLPAIVALVGANCAAIYLIENPTIAVALGNIIGASVTYLWQERSQVVGFFFGSSMGSKDKQNLLGERLA